MMILISHHTIQSVTSETDPQYDEGASSTFRQSSNPVRDSWKSQASSPWAKQPPNLFHHGGTTNRVGWRSEYATGTFVTLGVWSETDEVSLLARKEYRLACCTRHTHRSRRCSRSYFGFQKQFQRHMNHHGVGFQKKIYRGTLIYCSSYSKF